MNTFKINVGVYSSYNSQTTLNQFCSKIKYVISCNL